MEIAPKLIWLFKKETTLYLMMKLSIERINPFVDLKITPDSDKGLPDRYFLLVLEP